ncbi:MAG: type I-C CRISPR-associated endonuclease Cas1c [Acinetobacter sp.]|uniref:type I-C CRISPR-associated endonuclease Cas1c n=1 Tax=Acinetobacter sp. TaxID=472 RepID=UPI00258B4645|nr:type I-C CRISPR-associated endonuclease Cas1c [Acinetobacter sp.]MCE1271876.1 type I-C CRISPR-associated endonuclease Cas1c [Acinetobacter sp.]
MRKLLNTLYVTSTDAYLARDGENIVVKVDNAERFRIPVHNIEGIVTMGYMGMSPAAMHLCAENKVAVSFVSESGKFLGRVTGPVSGNVLLRRKQYRIADDPEQSLRLSKLFVAGKIANTRTILQRSLRDHSAQLDVELLDSVIAKLSIKQRQALLSKSMDELRGYEGEAAMEYFSVFNQLILHQKSSFRMEGRNRRPPLDNVNALLSFIYVLLMHEVRAALESVGLDPCVGFLHVDRPGRQSLALDMMEEFRPFIADRLVLNLINRNQINGSGFVKQPAGGIIMDENTRKEVITAWQKRKQEEILHPFLEEKVEIGLLPYVQALLMARHLRGDLDAYPVYIYK